LDYLIFEKEVELPHSEFLKHTLCKTSFFILHISSINSNDAKKKTQKKLFVTKFFLHLA
jgi:hypothetical protein